MSLDLMIYYNGNNQLFGANMADINVISKKLNNDIRKWTTEVRSFLFRRPGMIRPILRLIKTQKIATAKRDQQQQNGLHIPPYMILSVTKSCNLNCKGCYDKAHNRTGEDMSTEDLKKLLYDAERLGTGIIITAGGEPFIRADLIDLLNLNNNLFFVVFTNGLLLGKPEFIKSIKSSNIYPIISIEGNSHSTDARRGSGIHAKTGESMNMMKSMNKHFGVSVTVTTENYHDVLTEDFQRTCRKKGASSIFYIDYVPFQKGTENIELNEKQRIEMLNWLDTHKRKDLLAVAFPGDEKPFGGCLAAGRGFLHIAADGSVEPCPFAPVSAENVKQIGLEQALRSPFLKAVRDNTELLEDESHGCALFHKKEELECIRKSISPK